MSVAPAFILSATPFGSGRDPLSITLHVHLVKSRREPQYGTRGQVLEPRPTISIGELHAEVDRLVLQLGDEALSAGTKAEPMSWAVVDGRIVPPGVPS